MSTDNIIAAFSEDDACRLTGISIGQLRYWDRTRFFTPSLAEDNRRFSHSRIYSFRDVACLKILNTIRNESKVPLQHLRDVRERLLHLGDDLWAKITLYILNRRVVFYNPETDQREDAASGQACCKSRFASSVAIWKRRCALCASAIPLLSVGLLAIAAQPTTGR